MNKSLPFFFLLILSAPLIAQTPLSQNKNLQTSKSIFSNATQRNFSRKGDFSVSWGYNISWYNKSDINFKGPGYDFTLQDVVAHDRPSKLSWEYLDPGKLTVAQLNLRFGYFIKDNYSISLGWDHMKYVMDIPQTVKIKGYIDAQISNPGISTGNYAGEYHGEPLTVNADMLTYEHTDGLNYVSVEVERYDDIWVPRSQKTSLTLETGIGAGTIIPRSDVHLFGVGANHFWNFSGYGFSAKAGLKFYITRGLYLQNSTKVGWLNMRTIHTTGRNDFDNASQKISFLENYTVLGYQF